MATAGPAELRPAALRREPHAGAEGLALAASALFAAAVGALVAIQARPSLDAVRESGFLGAGEARWALVTFAAVAAATVALALLLPERLRPLAAAPGLLALAAAAGAVATAGAEIWPLAAAALTLLAAWSLGRAVLTRRWLRGEGLQERPLAALAIGLGVLALAVYLLGRAGLLEWWTAGLGLLALAAAAGPGLVRAGRTARPAAIARSLAGSPLRAAAAGIGALAGAFAVIWAGAPETRYDALFYKGWLPAHWAATGEIDALLDHPTLNIAGLVELVAVPGHLLGAPGVGRYLQLLSLAILAGAVWRLGDRVGPTLGPLAALVVLLVPQLLRQASTAEESLALAVLCLGAATGALHFAGREPRRPLAASVAIGLLGGACAFGKLYVAPFGVALGLTWALAGRGREAATRAAGAAAGLVLLGAPLFVARWIETGNPVFPFLNSTFRSPHYPPADPILGFGGPNEVVDDPRPGGGLRVVRWLDYLLTGPTSLGADPFATGVLGLLPAVFVVALLAGWSGPPARRVVWGALALALVAWWAQWGYERFAVPYAAVALALALPALAPLDRLLRRRPAAAAAAGVLGLAAVAFFAAAVASFWNVPGRVPLAAAVGAQPEREYELEAIPDAAVLTAFNRVAERGAHLVGDAYARGLLRSDLDLSPGWEVDNRLFLEELAGAPPAAARAALERMGIRWVVLANEGRALAARPDYLGPLVAAYGEIVHADRLRDLYRLVDDPAEPVPLPLCDTSFRGEGCWLPAERVDAVPGLTDAEAGGLPVEQTLPACGGATYAVEVVARSGRDSTRVYLVFDQPDPLQAARFLDVPPGEAAVLHGTAPDGAATLTVVLDTLGPTAAVERVALGLAREGAGGCPR